MRSGGGSRGPVIASLLSALIVVTTAACGSSGGDDPPPPDPTTPSSVWTPEDEPTDEPTEGPDDVWPDAYGDDAHLDALWDACTAGDPASCESLYYESPLGSQYEAWGATCGGLTTGGGCEQEAPPVTEFSEYARVSTWYSPAEADDSMWVHFKAVDAGGYTVAEALGSDLLNGVAEADAMERNPEREALVDEVRRQMADAGWTELGVDGDWYEYVFGR